MKTTLENRSIILRWNYRKVVIENIKQEDEVGIVDHQKSFLPSEDATQSPQTPPIGPSGTVIFNSSCHDRISPRPCLLRSAFFSYRNTLCPDLGDIRLLNFQIERLSDKWPQSWFGVNLTFEAGRRDSVPLAHLDLDPAPGALLLLLRQLRSFLIWLSYLSLMFF